jgi:hypothetical protein
VKGAAMLASPSFTICAWSKSSISFRSLFSCAFVALAAFCNKITFHTTKLNYDRWTSMYRVRHKSVNIQHGGRGTHATHFVQLYPQPLYTASQVRTSRSWDEGVLTELCLTLYYKHQFVSTSKQIFWQEITVTPPPNKRNLQELGFSLMFLHSL